MREEGAKEGRAKICIIGAGICGLRVAEVLVAKGLDVTVFEARDRVGGRICQGSVAGHKVDLGPNWIHGSEGNPILAKAAALDLVTTFSGTVSSICQPDGKWMSSARAGSRYQEVWRILDEATQYSRTHADSIEANARMSDFFFERLTAGSYDQEERQTLLDIAEMWGAFIGTEWENQSLKHFWLEEGLEGDDSFVASTYEAIVRDMSQPLMGDIRLSAEVVRISSCGGAESSKKVTITLRDGASEQFDKVVCTCPLGWLNRNKGVFSPPLPPRLSQAIDNIGWSNLDKVFISFPQAFWMQQASGAGSAESIPIENLFLAPTYASSTNAKRWRQEMVSLASLPASCAHPTVMFYIYGEWGKHITGLVRDLDRDSQAYYETMDACFRPYYSRLPRFDEALSACRPRAFLSTDWQCDDLAGCGSFPNYPTGLQDAVGDIEVLRLGMGRDRGIWFAGDHVAPFDSLGTVHGAYRSAEYAAHKMWVAQAR